MVHTIEYDASQNEIVAVTVYQHNRAEVNRKFTFRHEGGQYEIKFANLPTCVEEHSIHVDGIGNATILDVVYHRDDTADFTSRKKDEIIERLYQEEDRIVGDIKIVAHQGSVLKAFSKTMDDTNVDIDKLSAYLDLYEVRKEKLNSKMAKLDRERENVKKQISERKDTIMKEEQDRSRLSAGVTIVLQASKSGEAELSLTYVVSDAYWTPIYDLRASLSSDIKGSEAKSVNLQYRASVYQTTGEDWKDVILTLSTASPTQNARIPDLIPVRISQGHRISYRSGRERSPADSRRRAYPPPIVVQTDRRLSRSRSRSRSLNSSIYGRRRSVEEPGVDTWRKEMSKALTNQKPSLPPQFLTQVNSQSTSGAISATFTIPGRSTITSVEPDEQVSHKVVIADLYFSTVDLEWITVPIASTDVFLTAKVTNTSEYVLLPGTANIYLDGSFITNSKIPFVNSNEKFSCSLGKDPSIRVSSSPETKKVKTVSGSILQSNNKTTTTTFERVVTVKNTRPFKLPRLIVKDQVYVSDDEKLKVKIIEPASLSETIKGSVSRLSRLNSGAVARWTPREDDNDDTTEDEVDSRRSNGLFEWTVELNAGATVELRTMWIVSAPHDLDWSLS